MTVKSTLYDLFIARRYDRELASLTDAARHHCVERLNVPKNAVVLDLGCGTGLNQPHLFAALGDSGRVVGVDASKVMLSQAAERARAAGYADRLTLIQADARHLPDSVPDNLDGLLITLFMSVAPAWARVFDHAFARLASGGRCAVMDTYWPHPSMRQRLLSWRYAADPTRPGHAPLRQLTDDFRMENFPPDSITDTLYIATGTKR